MFSLFLGLPAQPLADGALVLTVIASAQSEILLDASSLTSSDLAQVLLERYNAGVKVFILLPDTERERATSYLNSLSLAGLTLRLRPGGVTEGVIIVDRRYMFIGSTVGASFLAVEQEEDAAVISRAIVTFLSRFETSPPYTFSPDWRTP